MNVCQYGQAPTISQAELTLWPLPQTPIVVGWVNPNRPLRFLFSMQQHCNLADGLRQHIASCLIFCIAFFLCHHYIVHLWWISEKVLLLLLWTCCSTRKVLSYRHLPSSAGTSRAGPLGGYLPVWLSSHYKLTLWPLLTDTSGDWDTLPHEFINLTTEFINPNFGLLSSAILCIYHDKWNLHKSPLIPAWNSRLRVYLVNSIKLFIE